VRVVGEASTIEDIMLLDRLNPFRSTGSIIDLQRRASLEESPVRLLSVRQLSEHEAFGLDRNASFETLRQSCWPIGPDLGESAGEAAGAPLPLPPRNAPEGLRALRAQCAAEMASPGNLETNLRRLDQIDGHYRAVALGKARLTDVEFATTTMRSFVTWLQSLTVLEEEQYGRCGECARKLLVLGVSPEPDSRFTVRELGTTSNLASPSDESATAAYFLNKILPLLRQFYRAVESKGVDSSALETRIDRRLAPPRCMTGRGSDGPDALFAGAREAGPQREVSRSLGDLAELSRVRQPLRDRPALASTFLSQGAGLDR
jgi:hypothetical protein